MYFVSSNSNGIIVVGEPTFIPVTDTVDFPARNDANLASDGDCRRWMVPGDHDDLNASRVAFRKRAPHRFTRRVQH